jgi:hypothetical protein
MIRGRKEGKSYATWFIGFDNGKNYLNCLILYNEMEEMGQ